METSDKAMAYGLLRVALGVNFAGHGLARIWSGVGAFAQGTALHLAKGPLPHGLVLGFAMAIPWIEAVLGVVLLLGVGTRLALVGGALFVMSLTVGMASIQQWEVVGEQLVYSLVFFVLLFLREWNGLSVDGWLESRR